LGGAVKKKEILFLSAILLAISKAAVQYLLHSIKLLFQPSKKDHHE
jgi:hypothetical protein